MRACFGVDALLGQAKALDWLAAKQVLFHDLRSIFRLDVAVPDSLGIHHDGWPVFALVKASGFIDPHFAGQTGFLGQLLQLRMQLALSIGCAGRARRTCGTCVVADENVMFENWQAAILRDWCLWLNLYVNFSPPGN
jgi:hypothetical protein